MSKKINPYDRSLKILARLYPEIFLSLLMDLNEDIEVMVENPEINLPEKRGDYAWRVSDGRGEGYFIFEFQLKADEDALKSAYVKCALLHEATGLPVMEKELIMQVEDEKERADLLSIAMTLAFHFFVAKIVSSK